MRRDSLRLADTAEAALIVETYLAGVDQAAFLTRRLLSDAVLRQLIVVGEAAFKLSEEFKTRHPEIPWAQIAGFRHRLVHDYFGLDFDAIWQIASVELPALRIQILAILSTESPSESPGESRGN